MARMERQQRVAGTVALVVAVPLAVLVVVAVIRALGSRDWVVASIASVLLAAAVSQWAAVRARRRGGRLRPGEVVLLVLLGALGLTFCGLDFVTGTRDNRAFTMLFAAGLIIVVGGVVGTYRPSARPGAAANGTSR
jgi:uncharacterized membrane protein YhaH (DUF805 family)